MTDKIASPLVPDFELDWSQIASAVLASKDIKDGLWRLGVKLKFAPITAHMPGEAGEPLVGLPTSLVAIEGFGLFSTKEAGPMVFDASNNGAPAFGEPVEAIQKDTPKERKKPIKRAVKK